MSSVTTRFHTGTGVPVSVLLRLGHGDSPALHTSRVKHTERHQDPLPPVDVSGAMVGL